MSHGAEGRNIDSHRIDTAEQYVEEQQVIVCDKHVVCSVYTVNSESYVRQMLRTTSKRTMLDARTKTACASLSCRKMIRSAEKYKIVKINKNMQ